MLCLVRYLFIISTSVTDCLGRFVSEMTYHVSIATLKLTNFYCSVGGNTAVVTVVSMQLSALSSTLWNDCSPPATLLMVTCQLCRS